MDAMRRLRVEPESASIGGLLVFPLVSALAGGAGVRLVVVKDAPPGEGTAILGSSFEAVLRDAGGRAAECLEAPGPGPLAEFGSLSAQANADFRFAEVEPATLQVRLRGEEAGFRLGPDRPYSREVIDRLVQLVEDALQWLRELFSSSSCKVASFPRPAVGPMEADPNATIRDEAGVEHKGVRILARFSTEASFVTDGAHQCSCCEYRQLVRGWVKINGNQKDFRLPSGLLDQLDWKEDGLFVRGKAARYGHRDEDPPVPEEYRADRPDGCSYRSWDAPHLACWPAPQSMLVHLEFRGQIIDACGGGPPVEQLWTVHLEWP